LFRQMRIVSTASFGVSLRTVFISSDCYYYYKYRHIDMMRHWD